ncbi:MAG: glycosyltransferase [Rubrobacter sp.]
MRPGNDHERPTIVILSGVRWRFLWQRHQTLATLFAGAGYPTIFVETTGLSTPRPTAYSLRLAASRIIAARPPGMDDESGVGSGGFRRNRASPIVYSPLVAPPTARLFRLANARRFVPKVVRDLRLLPGLDSGERPVVIAYPPTRTTLEIVSRISPRLLYYDCSDKYTAFSGAPYDLHRTEREMLLRAELVSCTSEHLLGRVQKLRPDALLLGPGVEYERFAGPEGEFRKTASEAREICYFGDVTEERTNTSVLAGLAKAGFRVRLVGEVRGRARRLLRRPNVEYRGVVEHKELPDELRDVDALIMPYKENALTRGISPAKLYECLATGLPVVATPLPALEAAIGRGLVYPAGTTEEYIEILSRLGKTESEKLVQDRRKVAENNSWENLFSRVEGMIWRELARNRNE